MSIKIMSRVWEHSQQSGTRLLVLLALADVANDQGVSWYSKAKLAARVRTSERSIPRIVSALEEDGEAVRVGRKGTSNYYVVLTGMSDDERAELSAELARTLDIKGLDLTSEGCQNCHGGDDETVTGG